MSEFTSESASAQGESDLLGLSWPALAWPGRGFCCLQAQVHPPVLPEKERGTDDKEEARTFPCPAHFAPPRPGLLCRAGAPPFPSPQDSKRQSPPRTCTSLSRMTSLTHRAAASDTKRRRGHRLRTVPQLPMARP